MTACVIALFLQILPLRCAWLSDLHVGAPDAERYLTQTVHALNRIDDIRCVLISGDITEMGSDQELLTAHTILARLRHPFHIIPGNHDTKWSASGTTTFPRLFGNDRFVVDYGGYRFVGLHQGPRLRMADGHWAPEDLRWLDTVLTGARASHAPLILVTHYPVDSSISNWYAVLDKLDSCDVRLMLAGHGHQNAVLSFEGYPAVMGRALSDGASGVPGYNMITFAHDSLTVTEMRGTIPAGQPWYSRQMSPTTHRRDSLVRPDFAVNRKFPAVREIWKWNSGFTMTASPAAGHEIAVVTDASGNAYGLRLTDGLPVWTHHTGGPAFAGPFVADDRVVMTSADSTVQCLDLSSGNVLWTYKEQAPVVAAPLVSSGRVFVGGSDGQFRCLDLSSGRECWVFPGVEGFVETRPCVHNGNVFFGSWGGAFYALDARTGLLSWKWHGPRPNRLFSPAACWPVATGDKVFIVAPDRAMTALRCDTGTEVWRSAEHQVRESIGISADSSLVLVRTMRDSLIAIDAREDTRHDIWTSTPGFGYDINAAMPVSHDGVVFYGSKNGFVFALRARTGRLLWVHRTGAVPVNTLLPLGGHKILATDFDGNVILLEGGYEGRD